MTRPSRSRRRSSPRSVTNSSMKSSTSTVDYSTLDDANKGDNSLALGYDDGDEVASRRTKGSIFGKKSSSSKQLSAEMKQPLTKDVERGDDVEDPFYVFREDLYRKLDLVDETLTEYTRIIRHTDTAVNTHALKDSKKELKRRIKNAEGTLRDVGMTVTMIETHPEKFGHIDKEELYDRQALVSTSKDRLQRAKQEMSSEKLKKKMLADERAKAMRRAAAANGEENGTSSSKQNENDGFVADAQAQTSLLMQSQDDTLDELGEAVTRVGVMADSIHEEIGLQNKMLTEMDNDLADAEEKLGMVMGKLAKFLKTKNRWQLGTILMLCVIVVLLVFILIYF
mmetsp:Transcript_42826/g.63534  ORF Transcript_42826/g.63534 Transcript_42826/m.63534 type:complete len:339 (-) Transcript_42826:105-1121(-)|eukprot:CAMPEP_0194047288 /NCGR_PEP_ID=MMETSP0009_2-20130614/23820_1 /TAXON_ID=210454 /ORGANISM="Grammatophora oceanica, Strain CCMP 410" /LENGTH=338 /DNA_ID=CAMNT_0038692845 /DNA_START=42 /DNA_END=1058 /DNA_ORIENTATION=-